MSTTVTLTNQLMAVVGAEHLVEHDESRSIYGHLPVCSVVPADVEELSAVLAICHEARMGVVPWGGGTHQRWGGMPHGPFVAVQTNRLNRVLVYEPDDLTISLQAGMRLADVNATLAANNQMLPLDVALPERATIGGALATAVDGPRRLGYGTARDLLIGIQVVEATGRISKAGGMVVKNVSGYDMMKLYLGSLGSLAIIVSANFKLMPLPRTRAGILATFATPAAAFVLVDAIHASQLTPVAVEYIQGEPIGNAAPTVAIWAEGLSAAVERHIRDLESMARQAGAAQYRVLRDDEHTAMWAEIVDLARIDQSGEDELMVRLACLPAELPVALDQIAGVAASRKLKLRIAARALNGVAYLRLNGAVDGLHAAHSAILKYQPHLTILGAPHDLLAALPVWGRDLPNLDLMRRIKQEFDPQNTMNPGRFVV
ncbi:MAG: FAD-binding oxidoreductase [Oscillochloris sp.]|nr:FAD-binding oxidoreductase [Oscillochloris sp.]